MSNSYYFRRRTIGRAASPPTWACYEQIPYDNDDDYSSSSSDLDEHDNDHDDHSSSNHSDSENEPTEHGEDELHMDMDPPSPTSPTPSAKDKGKAKAVDEDVAKDKGKQRAIDEGTKRRERQRNHGRGAERMFTLRPILTIQRSQGFVWNQDLFVPPYIKDRYVASTSPPNSRCFIPSASASSTNSALTDYEVEVVEIRVREGELRDIIP